MSGLTDHIRLGFDMQNGDQVVVTVDGFTDPLNALAALRLAGSEDGLTQIVQHWKGQGGQL
jgi:hypothetical protein